MASATRQSRARFLDTCRHARRRTGKNPPTFLSPNKNTTTLANYHVPGAFLNPTRLEIEGGVSEKNWMQIGRAITHVATSTKWWIGDWLLYGDKAYGRWASFDLAAQATGRDKRDLKIIKYVARLFEPARRVDALSFQHHAEVASLPPADQDELLQMAVDLGLTCHQTAELARQRRKGKPHSIEWHTVPVPMREEVYDTLLELAGGGKNFGHFVAGVLRDWLVANGHLKTEKRNQ